MPKLEVGIYDTTAQGVDAAVRNIDRLIVALSQVDKGVNNVEQELGGVSRASGAHFANIRQGFNSVTGAVFNLKSAMVGLGVGLVLREATRDALEFSTAMAEISTLLPAGSKDTAELTTSIRKLNVEFGGNLKSEAKAVYQIISAGAASAAQATDILIASNKLAIGGVTDVSIAADGLTGALNAYGRGSKEATDVSDAMFVAMRAGKTTIAELSTNIGIVAPLAAQAGVGIDELLAATSALTKGNMSTSVAMHGLRAIMAQAVKPSQEAADLSHELGIEFNFAALQSKGLAGFLEDVTRRTGGSSEKLAILFGGVEAIVPAMALAGKASGDFAAILDQMGNKSGQTEEALTKMMDSPGRKVAQLQAMVDELSLTLGESLVAGISEATGGFKDLQDVLGSEEVKRAAHDIGIVLAGAVKDLVEALKGFQEWRKENPDLFSFGAETGGLALAGAKVAGPFGAGVGALAGAGDVVGARSASDATDRWVYEQTKGVTGLNWIASLLEMGRSDQALGQTAGLPSGAVTAPSGDYFWAPPGAAPPAATPTKTRGAGGPPSAFDTAMADYYKTWKPETVSVDAYSPGQEMYKTNVEMKAEADKAKDIAKDKKDTLERIAKEDAEFQIENERAIREIQREGAERTKAEVGSAISNLIQIASAGHDKLGLFAAGIMQLATGDILGAATTGIGLVTSALGGSRRAHEEYLEAIQRMAEGMTRAAENALAVAGQYEDETLTRYKGALVQPLGRIFDELVRQQQDSLSRYRAEFGEESTIQDWGPDPDIRARLNALQLFFKELANFGQGGINPNVQEAVESQGFQINQWISQIGDVFGDMPLQDVGREFFNINDALEALDKSAGSASRSAAKLATDLNPVANALRLQFRGEELAAQARFSQAYGKGDVYAQREAWLVFQQEVATIRSQQQAVLSRSGVTSGSFWGPGNTTTETGSSAGKPATAEPGQVITVGEAAAFDQYWSAELTPRLTEGYVEVIDDFSERIVPAHRVQITPDDVIAIAATSAWDNLWSRDLLGRIGGSPAGGFAAKLTQFKDETIPAHLLTIHARDVLEVEEIGRFDDFWSRNILDRIRGTDAGGFGAKLNQFRAELEAHGQFTVVLRAMDLLAAEPTGRYDDWYSRNVLDRIRGTESGGLGSKLNQFRAELQDRSLFLISIHARDLLDIEGAGRFDDWYSKNILDRVRGSEEGGLGSKLGQFRTELESHTIFSVKINARDILSVEDIGRFDDWYSRNILDRIGGSEEGGFVSKLARHRGNVLAHRLNFSPGDFQSIPYAPAFSDQWSRELLPRLAGGPGAGRMGEVLIQHRENVNAHKIPFRPEEFMTIPTGIDFFNFWWEKLYPAMNYAAKWTAVFLPQYIQKINFRTVDIINFDNSGVQEKLVQSVVAALSAQRAPPLVVTGRAR